jgi:multidrug efflux pump subunit AcrA (membrane-fusion protein)
VEEARLAREQVARELARVEPLVRENLLPERRLTELRNELDTLSARLRSAQGRLGRVVTPGGAGGLAVKTSLDGIVSEVLVPNGEPVAAGAPLVRLGGTDHLWVRARFVAKPALELGGAAPTAVRLPNGVRVDLEKLGARFLSPLPVVDPASRIATWIVDLPVASDKEPLPLDLRPGAAVILAVRFGAPEEALVVPRSAVVEINTRPYVFVQVDGERFERRAVTPGAADGPWRRVLDGVSAGERVVTRGGYDIHLAALLGTIESHRH